MADPAGLEDVEAGPDALRPAELATMRRREQAGPPGQLERPREAQRITPALVVGQPEPDDPPACVLGGQPRERSGVQRVPGPVGGDDQGDLDPGPCSGVASGVDDQVRERRDAAEPRRESTGVDLDLEPARALGSIVLGRLEDQPPYVLLGPEHGSSDVVQPLEAEPSSLVSGRELRRPLGRQRLREAEALLGRELDDGRVPHRPGEVQVQVRLRQRLERSRGATWLAQRARRRWMRPTPSARSSSPSAYDSLR